MASNEETGTFTVPVGTRLSHGIELEILVAYLYTSEFDPDDPNSSNLAPILRVEPGSNDGNRTATVEEAIQEHIRTTLRNHGIRVLDPTTPVDRNVPLHLHGVDQWDVTNDITISDGWEEHELVRGKPGRYTWVPRPRSAIQVHGADNQD
ncbi:hypothetical protein NUW58_g2034 [Xylaria curta]|uniref:Uncharacterized protein n=1 Tax=Xylaria curta TaxID=42375 RepID=A0ACC1PIW1_9PEZI|nr:hypothetical protein NUW58_g2034 [Xylaria curta]